MNERNEILEEERDRGTVIVRTSIIGICANVLLAIFKAVVGTLSHSIAITMDSVNNLSDAMSSVITIIGTKLAGKAPDKEHPYGHGRVEYLSAMVIAVLVLYAGITSLYSSVKAIINPTKPDYSAVLLFLVAVAVLVKIVLGLYVRRVGKKVKSDSLVNSGTDALMDAIISAATLLAAFLFITTSISLEAYLAAVISIIIIKSGVDMFKESLSRIVGERVESELALGIKKTVASHKGVLGAYDLIMNNYGPDTYMASVHIEVPDNMRASEIDRLTREISYDVYKKHRILMTAVGIYSGNTDDPESEKVVSRIRELTGAHDEILQTHGFYMDRESKTISFDMVFDYDTENKEKLYAEILEEIRRELPEYTFNVTMDLDISD
ncbi:MAG: cation diffusion facilitator family transporter [Lachnospiraceae bacterium]|nr:cation diffusion facilitator family transporter [Lachnospiraceae bacterium]